MNQPKYDLVVLGAGPGGYVAAIRAAQLGLKTACVDENQQLGGTCLRVGCIPSKALLESSHLYAEARDHLAEHGLKLNGVELDVAAMLQRKDKIVAGLTGGVDQLLKKNKVDIYRGRGKLAGGGKVVVEGKDSAELAAKNILIATGSSAARLPFIDYDDQIIGDSTTALSYNEPPKRLVVIGGGYIGLELGSVWNRLGSKVTVLEALDRILPGADAEIARDAHRIFQKQGLEFQLGQRVKKVYVKKKRAVVEVEDAKPLEAERVLVAVGRSPSTKNLGLENAGVKTDERGFIQIDEHFATAAPGVYAIGDCVGGMMLAHKASEEGVACVEQLAGGHGHINYDTIPSIIYTHPEIASVGKTEDQLKESGREYRKGKYQFRANGRARTLGDTEGYIKMLADAKTDRLLGVHILGPRAGDLIAEAAAAMQFGASSEDLARTCHAHPTLAEAVHEAALAVDRRTIHA